MLVFSREPVVMIEIAPHLNRIKDMEDRTKTLRGYL